MTEPRWKHHDVRDTFICRIGRFDYYYDTTLQSDVRYHSLRWSAEYTDYCVSESIGNVLAFAAREGKGLKPKERAHLMAVVAMMEGHHAAEA